MKIPDIPHNEKDRLHALRSYQILDSMIEQEYDDITLLASEICGTPISLISFVDEHRQWFKSKVGLGISETKREVSICGHAINTPDEVMIVEDVRKDERFADNPLIVSSPNIVFYAGVPMVDGEGYALGTLCTIDDHPRKLTEKQINALKVLSRKIITSLSARRTNLELSASRRFLFNTIDFSTPYFLFLNHKNEILELGANFGKSIPEMEKGHLFDQYFKWESNFLVDSFLKGEIFYNKLLFYSSLDGIQRYKCSVKKFDEYSYIVLATPVINAVYTLSNYKLTLNNFPKHDYITEYVFLQQAAQKGLTESKNLNEILLSRNKQLEISKQALVNANNVLEERVNERTKKIKSLALFPEHNPNPVIELDYQKKEIVYLNPAAKKKIFNEINYSYDEFLALIKVTGDTIAKKDVKKQEFDFEQRIYERNLFFIENETTLRLYLHDITDIRLKERLDREKSKAFIVQQNCLLELRSLHQNLSFEDKLKIIHQKTAEHLHCDRTSIWLFSNDKTCINAEFIFDRATEKFLDGINICAKDVPEYFKALETKKVISASNAETHPATFEFKDFYLKPLNIKSMLDVPLIQAENSIGVICNEYVGEQKEFSDEDVSFARSIADIIVLAYEAEQLKLSQTALKEKNEALKEAMEKMVAIQSDVVRQEKMATLGMLIAGIAHEINTPLGAIKASKENIYDTIVNGIINNIKETDTAQIKSAIELFSLFKTPKSLLSTREERLLVSQTDAAIKEKFKALDNTLFFAKKIVEMGYENYDSHFDNYILQPRAVDVFNLAGNIIKLIRSTDTIHIAVEKASRVVKSLNNFSHGNINKEHTLYLLKESIDSAVVILWNKIKYGSNVQIDIAENVIIKGNQDELSQVWINLINNALQASDNNCSIKISHSFKNDHHELMFSNNGPRIPEDILPKIFDPFFSTKKRGEGTGLGLNIVKKIIEQHNGTINCFSSIDETSFVIKIPIINE